MMKTYAGIVLGSLFAIGFIGCTSEDKKLSQQDVYLEQQQDAQGYPVLIASPVIMDYGLPFCEKEYCIDVEIFGYSSKDQWFNQFVEQQISDLIRKQLGLSEKHSVQSVVDEFVKLSDAWQQQEKNNKPWQLYIYPNVIAQQNEITILRIDTEYKIKDEEYPQQQFYFVIDRKLKKQIKLYDIVKDTARIEFNTYIQQHYQEWLQKKTNNNKYHEKLSWASQDWYIDDEGIVIYYRIQPDDTKPQNDIFEVYLDKNHTTNWLKSQYLKQLYLK